MNFKRWQSLLFGLALGVSAHAGSLTPADLRCDYAINPLGVDESRPRLSWKVTSHERGACQTAWQILAASTSEKLARNSGDLWDSGKIVSDETLHHRYAGSELKSFQQVYWKVRSWDAAGKVSAWSKPATWTMGVLNEADWKAKWIGTADTNPATLLLRREFSVRPGLRRALVNICGLGDFELTLNGEKVNDDYLATGWTKFDKTCLYTTRDVTAALRTGKNAVGIFLGNGMYNVIGVTNRFTKFKGSFGAKKALAQLRLEYADGSVETVGTDETWGVAPGPVTFSSIYGGEDFDARREPKGWNQINFDGSKWPPAQVVGGPGGRLRGLSCAAPVIRAFEVHQPVARHTLTNGDIVYDLGQNASHVPRIRVTGPAGGSVRLIPSELVSTNGAADQSSMGGGRRGSVWCDFTKATDGAETWSPKFFYVGCRYVQVHCTPAKTNGPLPKIQSLAGIVVHSSSPPVGHFECSNPLFNRIRRLVRWAQRSNLMSVITDCPHRERLGWLEQAHVNGPALRYEFDLAQLFTKQLNDIADSQLTNGLVPTTAPEYAIFRDKNDPHHLRNIYGDSPEWAAAFILVPWQQYEFAGDPDLFRTHYDAMKNHLAYLGSRATNWIVNYGLGDWYDLGPKKPGISQLTPIALTGTAFYFEQVKVMARAAGLLGKEEEAKQFAGLSEKIRLAFNGAFYNATRQCYATGSQCANAIPLVMGICEPSNRSAVVEALVRDVRSRGNALTAGDVGYRYLLRALADGGRNDVIFEINNQSDKPGYGMQLAKGKTSLTEAWDGGASQNHFMLGQILEWFYHDLAGIQTGGNGFKTIAIAPQPTGDVNWVDARHESIRGTIESRWKRRAGRFTLQVSIPANTTATVSLPTKNPDSVRESGKPAAHSKGVAFIRAENGRAIFRVESGRYRFTSAD